MSDKKTWYENKIKYNNEYQKHNTKQLKIICDTV